MRTARLCSIINVSRKGSMVLEHTAGDKLFIDFSGKKLHYIDRSTGKLVACEVFVACLPFSDYAFAIAVPSQHTPDFFYVLSSCLESLGGVILCLSKLQTK